MSTKKAPSDRDISTLVALVRLKVGATYADISTRRLGEALSLTQQGASARLAELERTGLAERGHSGRGLGVRLTEAGMDAVRALYVDLREALEHQGKELVFHGSLFTGLREGGYYISLRGYARQFHEALGFVPYPGTLNLKLSTPAMVELRNMLKLLPGVDVRGFKDGRRTFGPV